MAVTDLSDPKAPDLFGDYFFELYNRSREAMLAKKEEAVAKPVDAESLRVRKRTNTPLSDAVRHRVYGFLQAPH